MKRWVKITFLVIIGIPVLWVTCHVAGIFWTMQQSVNQAKSLNSQLQKPEVFTPAAFTLARMCQAGLTNEYERYTNLVPHLKSGLGDCWGSVSSNGAHMEFGGGFWHFGYELARDNSKSNIETNHWTLTMYTEGESNRTLLRFSSPVTETIF